MPRFCAASGCLVRHGDAKRRQRLHLTVRSRAHALSLVVSGAWPALSSAALDAVEKQAVLLTKAVAAEKCARIKVRRWFRFAVLCIAVDGFARTGRGVRPRTG